MSFLTTHFTFTILLVLLIAALLFRKKLGLVPFDKSNTMASRGWMAVTIIIVHTAFIFKDVELIEPFQQLGAPIVDVFFFFSGPNKYLNSLKLSILVLISSLILGISICVGLTYLSNKTGNPMFAGYKDHLMTDSNKILAFIIGLSAFLVSRNSPQFYNKYINFFAEGTFAVLLIHASSDTMRQWLWQDLLHVPSVLEYSLSALIVHAATIPITIFILCSSLDYFRRRFFDKKILDLIFRNKKAYKLDGGKIA